jgi:biotin carboxyl carrier protein
MKFELEVADRLRTVEIRREADGYHVTVDGKPRTVDIVRVGRHGWSLLVRDDAGMRAVEATVVRQIGSVGLDVHFDGFHIPVQPKTGLGRRTRGVAGAQGSGPQRLVAPMPGKVVRVLVAPGDEVKARQGLVVVEAMKMENELRAAREGRVREVLVKEGQSVEAGAALVVIE